MGPPLCEILNTPLFADISVMLSVSQRQNVGNCRASGLSKLKHGSSQSDSAQKDISAYFQNSFAFQKRYFVDNNNNDSNNNNNNNTRDNVYGAVVMTQVIARIHLVHLTNVGQRQMAADP